MAQGISQEQEGPDGVRERVIAYGGRKCTEAEKNYSSNKGETATLIACGWAGAVMEKVTGAFGQEQ